MKIKTSVAAFFTTLFSLALILLILLAPQSALAVGCTGAKCNGLNPAKNGCGADQKPMMNPVPLRDKGGVMELKYSPACQAYWAKIINTKKVAPIWISLYQQQASQWVVISSTAQITTAARQGEVFTNMWASFPAYSCGYIQRSSTEKVWVCSKIVYSPPS